MGKGNATGLVGYESVIVLNGARMILLTVAIKFADEVDIQEVSMQGHRVQQGAARSIFARS
jgi:hypothetical protein